MTLPAIELPAALERVLSRGHPWVYRDHVPRGLELASGSWVRVRAGRFVGYGLWDARSPIAIRIYSRKGVLDGDSIAERVEAAYARREVVRASGETDAYRMVHGEGDRLPGIVVDAYGPFAVVSTDTPAVEPLMPPVYGALSRLSSIRGIVRRHRGDAGPRLEPVEGQRPEQPVTVKENGLKFRANLYEGQKTGLFLDHRDNRRFIESVARGRRVLNLYAYSGAFSLYAVRGGATHVTSVDRAVEAIRDAKTNFELNGYDPAAHDFVGEDVETYLRRAQRERETFDLVIADPPSFARSKEQVERALGAYARLSEAALHLTAPEGLYAGASCTGRVTPPMFVEMLSRAASKVRRDFLIVHEAGHAQDHPVMAGHPEGRYLKFVVGRVEPAG